MKLCYLNTLWNVFVRLFVYINCLFVVSWDDN